MGYLWTTVGWDRDSPTGETPVPPDGAGPTGRGQGDGEQGPPLGTVLARQGAVVVADDALADAQPQARAGLLGAGEGAEEAAGDGGVDPGARVRHRQANLPRRVLPQDDAEAAAVRHGVQRVEEQVDQDAGELVAIDLGRHRAVRQSNVELHVLLLDARLHQVEGVADQLAEIAALAHGFRGPGEVEQRLDLALQADDLLVNDPQVLGGERAGRLGRQGGADEELDARQGVADLVGHAGGQLADSGQLLGSEHLLLLLLRAGDDLADAADDVLHLLVEPAEVSLAADPDGPQLLVEVGA